MRGCGGVGGGAGGASPQAELRQVHEGDCDTEGVRGEVWDPRREAETSGGCNDC